MNKLLIKVYLLIAATFILLNSVAFAAPGPASAYKVRLSKFELFNGTSWITAFEGTSATLDIASVSIGSAAGDFMSGLSVPDGTYTQIRVTPSPTFTISGRDTLNNYTTAALGVGGGCTPTLIAGQQAECTITLTGGNIPGPDTIDISDAPIIIKDGVANKQQRVRFDVSTTIQLIVGELWPAAPNVE